MKMYNAVWKDRWETMGPEIHAASPLLDHQDVLLRKWRTTKEEVIKEVKDLQDYWRKAGRYAEIEIVEVENK
jgi:hypothetical protein